MDREALKSEAVSACIDIYMDFHVSEMRKQPESVKRAWLVGQDLYAESKNSAVEEIFPGTMDRLNGLSIKGE